MNPVVHFEMPAEDGERVKAFYAEAFGWQMQTMGPEMGNYILASTTETDEAGRPQVPGAINGGFFQKTDQYNVPSLVISVDDIQKAMQNVAQAGGTVLGGHSGSEPDVIPGVGLFVSIVDTEGNLVGLMQPVEMH